MIVIEFFVPLPPVALRANGRAHHMVKKRLADGYSEQIYELWLADRYPTPGWKEAHVTYTWCYTGVAPDAGNLSGNTKYLQDILCSAPRRAGKDRYYMGIVEDDKGITPTYLMERVAHKADEGVHVRIESR